jgi:hypothetical protein
VTPSRIAQQLTQLTTNLFANGHAIDAQTHKVVDAADRTQLVTWTARTPDGIGFPHDKFATLEEYLFFLEHRQFSAVLRDGALVQASYRLHRNEIVWHRLALIPCPIVFEPSELEDISLPDFLSVIDPAELKRRVRLRSAIRFDYDPLNARPQHPASHATLNDACCRIPVRSPVHLRAFVRFVFSNFYPDLWENEVCLHAIDEARFAPCIAGEDVASMHLHWHP